ncbi:MAG: hypothetical protein ACKVS9_14455 [Phycisphaerae bacterium]
MKISVFGASILLATLAFAVAGCDSKSPPQGSSGAAAGTPKAAAAQLPPDLFVAQPPEGAVAVGKLKADAAAPTSIVVYGRIGGRKEPFVAGSAMFLLADMSMKACSELEGDLCATPWDYCCEPKENLSKMLATVQVLGPDGKPLAVGLDGTNGLKPLAELTITCDIASREGGALVLTAKKIYVHPKRG